MKITIPKGKHYDLSLSRIWHRFLPFSYRRGKVIVFEARILTEPYDIRPDPDQSDRHKLFGINLNFYKPSDHNSIMVTFQANPKDNTWDSNVYVNALVDGVKSWVPFPEFQTKAGDLIRAEFTLQSRTSITVDIYLNGNKVNYDPYIYTWTNGNSIRFPSLILPWHGGEDNDNNDIGGVAPVDIAIELAINK